tara:strand:+ start:369 stop:605 length:237 start_codon:yes stop_codon:yes gene_type:complete
MSKVVEVVTISKEEYNKLKLNSAKLLDIQMSGIDFCASCNCIYDGSDLGWRDSKVHGELSICEECEWEERENEKINLN